MTGSAGARILFAAVFFRNGLPLLGMLFVAAAVVDAMLVALRDEPAAFSASPALRTSRRLAGALGYLLAPSLAYR